MLTGIAVVWSDIVSDIFKFMEYFTPKICLERKILYVGYGALVSLAVFMNYSIEMVERLLWFDKSKRKIFFLAKSL